MRNHIKWIAAGVGLFSAGGAIAWAVTADYYEQEIIRLNEDLRSSDEYVIELEERIHGDGLIIGSPISAEPGAAFELDPEEVYTETKKILGSANWVEEARADLAASEKPFEVDETKEEALAGEDPVPDEELSEAEEAAKTEAIRARLQEQIDTYSGGSEAAHDFVERVLAVDRENMRPPYVISHDEYSWGEAGLENEKNCLIYYREHRVLLDDEGDLVPDPDLVVGWRNLTQFGAESNDPNVVYIRNDRLDTDFEVTLEETAPPPAHILYGMPKEEFEINKKAGLLRLRPEDE